MKTKKRLWSVLIVVLLTGLACTTEALAVQISLAFDASEDDRVLGFAYTGNAPNNAANDQTQINALLDTPLNTNMTGNFFPAPSGTDPLYRRTDNDPLLGSYPDAAFAKEIGGSNSTSFTLDGSYQYLMATYDGPNSYRVLWYIGDLGVGDQITIPLDFSQYPDGGSQFAVSHTRVFNPTTTSVPDGGATVALLGLSLGSIGLLRSRFGALRK